MDTLHVYEGRFPGWDICPGVHDALDFSGLPHVNRNLGFESRLPRLQSNLAVTGLLVLGGGDTANGWVTVLLFVRAAKSVQLRLRVMKSTCLVLRKESGKTPKDEGREVLFNRQPIAIVGEDRV